MKNKVVIITGASSGIGEACAISFANKGAKIVIAARNMDKLTNVANQITKIGVEVKDKQTIISLS